MRIYRAHCTLRSVHAKRVAHLQFCVADLRANVIVRLSVNCRDRCYSPPYENGANIIVANVIGESGDVVARIRH